MTKSDILRALKQVQSNTRIRFPRDLELSIYNRSLSIKILKAHTYANMQTDAAAFEGWALVLKSWLPKQVTEVVIEWDDPELKRRGPNNNKWQHYQRFLYRVKRFTSTYQWASVHPGCLAQLHDLLIDDNKKYKINIPSKVRPRTNGLDTSVTISSYEPKLEEYILANDKIRIKLMKELSLDLVDNQLPLGVFENEVSNYNKIFTGGASAIDIWGINKDKECCIFELKNADNKKVGALTEMLFYSFVIDDVRKGLFEFNSTNPKGLNDIENSKAVKCYLLAPAFHPLIAPSVISLMNTSSSSICYGMVTFSTSFAFKIKK